MKNTKLLIVIVMVAGLLGTSLAKGMNGRKGNYNKQNDFKPIIEELKLTDVQNEKLYEMRKEQKLKMIEFKSEMEKLKVQKQDARVKLDFSKQEDLIEQKAAIRIKMEKLRIEGQKQLVGLLTEEQLKTYKKLIKERPFRLKRGKFGKRRGNNNGNRPHRPNFQDRPKFGFEGNQDDQ